MTEPTDHPTLPLRVAELLCSRLCHDIISPVAAISNGLELLDDDADDEITSLLSFSVGQAAGWLMYFRVAYGLGGENADALTLSEVTNLIRGIVEEDKISLNLPDGEDALGRAATKMLLNAVLVGLETLPNRGRLSVAVDCTSSVKVVVTAEGDGVAMRPETRGVLGADADVSGLTARSVQGFFTAWLARNFGSAFVVKAEEDRRIEFAVDLPAGG